MTRIDESMLTENTFLEGYLERLCLPSSKALRPTYETLCLVTRQHLELIPFENLAWHLQSDCSCDTGNDGTAKTKLVELNPLDIVRKFVTSRRGGCCLELNGGLAWLLQRIGFQKVHLVPCFVAAGRERGHANARKVKFRTKASHFIILVDGKYLVDVGLGEPPIEPLRYNADVLGKSQVTQEGMTSRIVWDPRGHWMDGQGKSRKCLLLEWLVESDTGVPIWQPRLQWDVADAPLYLSEYEYNPLTVKPNTLESFRNVIPLLAHPKSSWSRKLVVCRISQTHKVTLAGQTLKITSPRFGARVQQTKTVLSTDEAVRQALKMHFGIVLEDQERFDWKASRHAQNTPLWDHL